MIVECPKCKSEIDVEEEELEEGELYRVWSAAVILK